MTFREKYIRVNSWPSKAIVMEIFHLAMSNREQQWNITKTAEYFGVSIGLVSENLRLAHAMHSDDKLHECESRTEALRRLNGNHYYKTVKDE